MYHAYGATMGSSAVAAAVKQRLRSDRPAPISAILLAIFAPWSIFCITNHVMSFSTHYEEPETCYFTVFLCFMVVLSFGYLAHRHASKKAAGDGAAEPVWTGFLFATAVLAWVAGCALGQLNFISNMEPFYDVDSLHTRMSVDPLRMRGQQLLDAGRVMFTEGSRLDLSRQGGLKKDGVTYCVAPVTMGNATLASYDFWAVGTDCCSGVADDFHCGAFDDASARGGVRLLQDGQRAAFELAVLRAETSHGLHADHPIFFHWVRDPLGHTQKRQGAGFKFFVFGASAFFAAQLFAVSIASWSFPNMSFV